MKLQDEPPGSTWEAALDHLAEQAALFRDVGLAHLGSHVHAAFEIARSRASERGESDIDTPLTEILAAIRKDVDARLAWVEAAERRAP